MLVLIRKEPTTTQNAPRSQHCTHRAVQDSAIAFIVGLIPFRPCPCVHYPHTHTHTHTARETDRSILRVRGAPTKGAQTQNTLRSHQSLENKENELTETKRNSRLDCSFSPGLFLYELTETKRNNPGDCSVVAQIAHKLIHIHSVSLLLSFSLSLLLLLQYTVSQCFLKIG